MNPTFTLWATPALKRMALALFFLSTAAFVHATTYFLKPGANAQALTSWGTSTDGTGTAPTNFTGADNFTISAGTSGIVSANWTIGGTNSSLTLTVNGTLTINSGVVLTLNQKTTGGGAHSTTTVSVNGTLIFLGTATANQIVGTISGTATLSDNRLIISSGATVKTPNGSGLVSTTNGSINSTNLTFTGTGANYEFNGNTAQLTIGLPATVGNLTFSGTGSKTTNSGTQNISGFWDVSSPADLTINNTIVNVTGDITGTGALQQGAGHITVAGNWNRAATANFVASGAGVTLTGTNKTIAGNSGLTFTTLTINGTYTNNQTGSNSLAVSTDLGGTGTLTQTAGAKLNIGGNSTITTLIPSGAGNTVTYTGTNQTVKAADYQNLSLSGNGTKATTTDITVAGTMTVNGGVVFTPGSNNTVSGSGLLAGTGTIQVTRIGSGGDLVTQYPIVLSNTSALQSLTVDYAGVGTQTVNAYTYGNVLISGSGTKTAGGSFYSTNNLTITGSATLDLLDWNADNTAVAPATNGTISVSDGAALRVGGNHKLPQNYTMYTFTPASTVEYYGGGTHAIVERTYGNLRIIDNNTVVTTSGALTISGDLTIGSGATFNATNSSLNPLTHTIKGNWTNDGTFNASTTTINFNGTTAQSINGANTTTFYNLSINNSNGLAVNKTAIVDVNGVLTFGTGVITTSTANLLILNDNASVTGVSNASHVNGPIRKIGNDAFTFPVGKNGKYVPISISAPGDINDAFTAEYFPQSGSALGPISSSAQGRGLQAVSGCEYWVLDRTAGASAVDVTLSWGPDNACSGPGYITNPFFLVVAHYADPDKAAPYTGGTWDNFSEGTDNVITGTATGGTVTWKNVSTFSPFTIGSTDASQAALPVTFVSFTGKKVESGNQLTWKVAGETNVKQYDIERSAANNNGFVKIGSVLATGNDNYSFMDVTAASGTVYYRLKNVDYNGKFKYSTVLSLKNGMSNVVFKVVPTIAVSRVTVQHNITTGTAFIFISTIDGKAVRNIRLAAGSMQTEVDMNNLQHGLYVLKYNDGNGHVEVAKVLKQ